MRTTILPRASTYCGVEAELYRSTMGVYLQIPLENKDIFSISLQYNKTSEDTFYRSGRLRGNANFAA